MGNYKFTLSIEPEDIYNRLKPEEKKQFDNVKITNVNLLNNGTVEVECIAFDDEIIENPYLQKLFGNGCISII